jgi:mannose-6-phosphate isomerase-like protein (cupin superfamily)
MIVGYWPGTLDESPALSLPSLTVPASAEMMGVSLTRIELGPGADPTPLFAPVPHLLIVEAGTLMIAREHAFEIARGGASRFTVMAADPGAEELHVGPGDALLLPEVLSHQVRNTGKSSASALSLMVAPTALLFHQIRAGPSSQVTVELMHDGWRVGRRTAWDNDTITETLAVKHLPIARLGSAVELSGSQIALDVGQRNPPLTAGKLRLAIVRSGVVGVSVINSDTVAISVNRPDSALGTAANHLFWAGDAFWIEDSEAPVLANAGVTPLDILLIDIAPLDDDSGATPTSYATEPQETLPGSVQSMPPRCPVPSVLLTPVSC